MWVMQLARGPTRVISGLLRALALLCVGVGLAVGLSITDAPADLNVTPPVALVVLAASFAAYTCVGALVVQRADGHPVGWLFLTSGTWYAVGLAGETLAKRRAADGVLDSWSALGSWVYQWSWDLAAALAVMAIALFPHRGPQSRFVRWLLGALVVNATVQLVALALVPGLMVGGSHETNPFGVTAAAGPLDALVSVTEGLSWVLTLVALAALLARYRRTPAGQRRPLRAPALAAAALLAASLLSVGASLAGVELQVVPFLLGVVVLPCAMAVAILRDHLYDIEVVVNRMLVYAVLLAMIAGVYAVAALLVSALFVGRQAPSALAAVAALVVVSFALAPARERAQRWADRLVFGRRATPYHALAAFAEHAAGAGNVGDAAPRLAGLLRDATGAAAVVVYGRTGAQLHPLASDPAARPGDIAVAELPTALAAYDLAVPVERRGEVLGALALSMPPGRPVRPVERRLVRQLAAAAALSFETLRLTSELTRHADVLAEQAAELHLSRLRLVQVQDAERQRIGRDLHDGAQQNLVAVIAKAGLARAQLARDPSLADLTLGELQQDARTALSEIRELVHGIFPPILQDRGLVVAVQQRAARLPVEAIVHVDADPGTRFDPSVESAAWFVVSEALANIVKHAGASRVDIDIQVGPSLLIDIVDDGIGLGDSLPGQGLVSMSDRVAALDGQLFVGPGPGGGTALRCLFPLLAPVPS